MTAISEPLPTRPAPRASTRLGEISLSRALPWLVGALTLTVGLSLVDGLPVGVMWDDAMYVILAKALATGQGYRWIHLPGSPPATHFPPGYPAVLAVLWRLYPVFPANVVLFKCANACFSAISAALVVKFVRERCQFGAALAVALGFVSLLGIPSLVLSVVVMSEPLFLTALLVALLLAERVVEDTGSRQAVRLLGLGALIGALTLVRTHGIALIAALPAVLAFRRRWRDALVVGAAAVLVVLPWQLWASAHAGIVPEAMRGNYESYGAWFARGLHRYGLSLVWRTALRTVGSMLAMFATITAPSMPAPVRLLALVSLGALTALGVPLLRKSAPVTALFLAFYLAIVVVWPFTPARFIWGIWPLIVVVPVLGARRIAAWRPSIARLQVLRVVLLCIAVLDAVGHGFYTLRGYRGRWWSSIPRSSTRALAPAIQWASESTPRDAVLGVENEGPVYLYSGRRDVPILTFTVEQFFHGRTPEENASVVRSITSHYPVTAVLITSPGMRDAARTLVSGEAPAFVVRDSFPGGLVLVPRTH